MSVLQIVSVAFFYGVILAVGVHAGMRRESSGTLNDLLLGSRRLPLWIGVLTMTATWVGGGYINGTAEAVYDPNLGLVWAQAPWGYAISLVLGGLFFAGRMRRLGCTTLLDPFELRYGKQMASLLFVPALVGEVFWSAAILVALGTTFGVVMNVDLTTAILVSATVAVGYTIVGGLWSVAYTDVVQLACILVGLGVAIPFAVTRVGGWETVAERYVAQMPSFPTGTAVWVWVDMALLLMLGGIPWQVYFQRVLACPDARTSVRLSWIAGICCLLMAMPAVMIGAVGAVADWSQTSAGEPPRTAMVLPYVLQYWTPPAVAVIGLSAVAAAVMSSVDSSILSASSLFVCNVYRPLIHPTTDDRQSRRVLRGSIVVIGVVATCLALSVQSVYALWYLCADFVYVILFPQFVMVLYSSMANRIGAAAGLAVSLLLRLGGGEPMLGLPAWIPYPLEEGGESHFPVRTFAMLSGLSTIWLVSRFTRNIDPPRPLTVPDSADSV